MHLSDSEGESVKEILRRWWGIRDYRRRVGNSRTPFPLTRDELVKKLNEKGRWKSREAARSLEELASGKK